MKMGFIQIARSICRIIDIKYIHILITDFLTMVIAILCFCFPTKDFTVTCFQIVHHCVANHRFFTLFHHGRPDSTIGGIQHGFGVCLQQVILPCNIDETSVEIYIGIVNDRITVQVGEFISHVIFYIF